MPPKINTKAIKRRSKGAFWEGSEAKEAGGSKETLVAGRGLPWVLTADFQDVGDGKAPQGTLCAHHIPNHNATLVKVS